LFDTSVFPPTPSENGNRGHGTRNIIAIVVGAIVLAIIAAPASGAVTGSTVATSAQTSVVVVSVPQMTAPAALLQRVKTSFSVAWSVADPGTWLASYDVRYSAAFYDSGFSSPVRWLTRTTTTSAMFSGLPGYSYCFSARARDTGGNLSAWSGPKCTAVPVDDRSLTRSGSWSSNGGSGNYLGTNSASRTHGATLSLSQVKAKRLSILVKKCPGCGEIEVFWNGASLGVYSLVGTHQIRQVVNVPAFGSIETGTVTIQVSSASDLHVEIDGLGVRRS
jgi:hypothetical protein